MKKEKLPKDGFYCLEPGKSPQLLTQAEFEVLKEIIEKENQKKPRAIEFFKGKDELIKMLLRRNRELTDDKLKIDRQVIEMAGQLDKMLGSIRDLTLKS